jgi:sterol desaturase/sphingolipid hydroxylase (fatty acid hydroxylase superfamily)
MTLDDFLAFALAPSNFTAIALVFGVMAVVSALEVAIPLRARGRWNNAHLAPNLTLTVIYFAANLFVTAALVLMLIRLDEAGLGLVNAIATPPWIEFAASLLVLDFQAYAAHVSMHKWPALWRFHAIHHADPAIDVTTALRQHPGESVIRFAFLAVFAGAAGAGPIVFALYRVLSAGQALSEHANIRLPPALDNALALVIASPNYHKVHHSRDPRLTDTNYANIFSFWDRLFSTHTPAHRGVDVDYGLEGFDEAADQTALGLLARPLRRRARPSQSVSPPIADR